MDPRRVRLLFWVPPLLALLLGGLLGFLLKGDAAPPPATPQAVADATLLSIREQGRFTPFVGRFVAVVTASETRMGLTARKTLIMPGTVRYGVDLARLRRDNLAWDEATRTLIV